MVSMKAEAVTARLRALATNKSGHMPAWVPLDRVSVTRRLRSLGELSDLCRRLGAIKGGRPPSR